MPLYFSAHNIGCLTKRDLRTLMEGLHSASEVQVTRSVASQIGGRMIVETEAPDQKTLEAFFQSRRFNCEWVMRIDLDGRRDSIAEL
jgi:hypothetical protein